MVQVAQTDVDLGRCNKLFQCFGKVVSKDCLSQVYWCHKAERLDRPKFIDNLGTITLYQVPFDIPNVQASPFVRLSSGIAHLWKSFACGYVENQIYLVISEHDDRVQTESPSDWPKMGTLMGMLYTTLDSQSDRRQIRAFIDNNHGSLPADCFTHSRLLMLAAGVLNINEQTRSQYELWTTTTGGIDLYNYIVSSLKDAKLSDDILLSVAALHALEQFAPSFSAAQQPPTLWRLHNFIFNEHHYDPISAFHMVASIHGSSKYRLGKPWTDIYQKLRLRKSNGQVCGDIMYFFEERLTYKTHYQALKMARILSRGDDDMLKQCIADANHDSESESDDSGSEDDESGLKHDDGKGVEGSQQTATAEAFKDEIQSLKHSLNEVQSLFRLIEGLAGGLGHEMKTGGEIKLEQPKIQEMGQLTEINSHTIAFETAFDKVSVSFECFKGKLASTLTQESKCDETIDEQRKGCEGAGVEGAVCKEGETKESEVKESESGEAVGMGEGTRVAEADSLERADAEWESLERLD